MTLSQRLKDGLIDEKLFEAIRYISNEDGYVELEAGMEAIKKIKQIFMEDGYAIEADLKGMLPKYKQTLCIDPNNTPPELREPEGVDNANGYNQAIDDMLAAIERYTRGTGK